MIIVCTIKDERYIHTFGKVTPSRRGIILVRHHHNNAGPRMETLFGHACQKIFNGHQRIALWQIDFCVQRFISNG